MSSNIDSDLDNQIRGYHDIPDDEQLKKMSYLHLAESLSSCEKGSTKFLAFERELNRHINADKAKANRSGMIIGAAIAGLSTVFGTVLGALITNTLNPSYSSVCDYRREGATKDFRSSPIPSAIESLRDREQTKHKQ